MPRSSGMERAEPISRLLMANCRSLLPPKEVEPFVSSMESASAVSCWASSIADKSVEGMSLRHSSRPGLDVALSMSN